MIIAVASLAILVTPACRTKRKVHRVIEEDTSSQIASLIQMSDPHSVTQLVRGFYDVENGAWRWAMKRFTVTLRPPEGSAQNGAKLELHFVIPDAVFAKTGAQTISAQVNGVQIPAQKYARAGEAVYSEDVPPAALHGDSVSVEFAAEKFIPPGPQDARELAIIVTSVGLLPK